MSRAAAWSPSCEENVIYRIDLKTNQVVAKVPVGPANTEGGIAFGAGFTLGPLIAYFGLAVFAQEPWGVGALASTLSLAALIIGGLVVLGLQAADAVAALTSPLRLLDVVIVALVLVFATFVHEAAHGVTLTHSGGRPRRAGRPPRA